MPPRIPQITEPVSILLPLRHDPTVALAAVRAAVAQRNVSRLDVVVLDVGCTEATYRRLIREYGDDPRVRLLDTSCLPVGWSRTSHRCQQLAVGARGRILFFADPAAPLGPFAAAAGAGLLRRQHLDLLVLDAGGRRHTGRFAVAADTEAYWRIGGHRAAAPDPHPLALLRAMRRARAATGIADGRRIIPVHTRVQPANLPAEPREAYFRKLQTSDFVDSSATAVGTTARRLLAAFRATGLDLAGFDGQDTQDRESAEGAEGGNELSARQRAWLEATRAGALTGTLCSVGDAGGLRGVGGRGEDDVDGWSQDDLGSWGGAVVDGGMDDMNRADDVSGARAREGGRRARGVGRGGGRRNGSRASGAPGLFAPIE